MDEIIFIYQSYICECHVQAIYELLFAQNEIKFDPNNTLMPAEFLPSIQARVKLNYIYTGTCGEQNNTVYALSYLSAACKMLMIYQWYIIQL